MTDPEGTPSTNLTAQQQKWFASVRAGLEKETGKSLAEWVEIARKCPETKPRARTNWLKEKYGIGINRASIIFAKAFPDTPGWDKPDELKDALWQDPAHRAILDRLEQAIAGFDGVTVGARKTFTAFSRRYQFAAARPHKGKFRLGLAVDPSADDRLEAPLKKEGWSDRLTASTVLETPKDLDKRLVSLLKQAWDAA